MAGTITPWFRQQWLDADGDPLSSGTLETYETGTSTPLATYSDAGLSVTNGTTITLNAGGFPTVNGSEVGIFLLPRAYRFVLKNSAGVTQRTIDGVYAYQPAASSNLEIDGVAGEALTAGEWAYESDGSGGLTDGRWYKTDSDLGYASILPNLAFVPADIAQGATGTLRIAGVADGLSGLTAGDTYYLSSTAGAITTTAPLNARAVGVARSATAIDLNFSPSWLGASQTLSADGRLTLTTAVPVTTADVTAATTLYYTPYAGSRLALFDGLKWVVRAFTELSVAVPATTSQMYDVFAFDSSGVVTLELTAWTNDTTRATALTTQDGVLVKTGATTRRYLGSFRTTGVSGQTEDSIAKRYVWNYYHRVRRQMLVFDTADTWNYTLAAFQQANANAANQLDFVIGVSEDTVEAMVLGSGRNTSASIRIYVGIGLDVTNANATGVIAAQQNTQVANIVTHLTASWRGYPGVGRHFLAWLEGSEASGTTTWLGDNGVPTVVQSGISGGIFN